MPSPGEYKAGSTPAKQQFSDPQVSRLGSPQNRGNDLVPIAILSLPPRKIADPFAGVSIVKEDPTGSPIGVPMKFGKTGEIWPGQTVPRIFRQYLCCSCSSGFIAIARTPQASSRYRGQFGPLVVLFRRHFSAQATGFWLGKEGRLLVSPSFFPHVADKSRPSSVQIFHATPTPQRRTHLVGHPALVTHLF